MGSLHRTCLITIYQYDYQHNTTISVQQFTFTTTVRPTCHSLGLDQEVRLIQPPVSIYTLDTKLAANRNFYRDLTVANLSISSLQHLVFEAHQR